MIYLKESKYLVIEYPELCSIKGNHEDVNARAYYVKSVYGALFGSYDFATALVMASKYALGRVGEHIEKKYFKSKGFDLPVIVKKDGRGYYIEVKRKGHLIKTIRPQIKKDSLQEVLGRAEVDMGVPVSLGCNWEWESL